jgi:hypothetical protein
VTWRPRWDRELSLGLRATWRGSCQAPAMDEALRGWALWGLGIAMIGIVLWGTINSYVTGRFREDDFGKDKMPSRTDRIRRK